MRRLASCAAKTALLALALGLGAPAAAQVSPEPFSDPVGRDPDGDNVLALRSLPSGTEGVRLARLGPDTLFTEVGRRGGWVNIRRPGRRIPARRRGALRRALVRARRDLQGGRLRLPVATGHSGVRECRLPVRRRGDVPLSVRQREQVARIRATERRLGCPP